MAFTLSSPAFTAGERIPRKFTCEGADVSPALTWSGAPDGTKSFALIADDPDAPVGTWVHWVRFNIPGQATGLPEGVGASAALPDGSRHGTNDFKRFGYGGPCPPPGPAHRYFFRLYALDRPLGLTAGATKAAVLDAMSGHVLGQVELMGKYKR